MSFILTKKNNTSAAEEKHYCRLHNQRIVQVGNCLTCNSSCGICEVKGCIKGHSQNQRIHNVVTIEYLRHTVHEFLNSGQKKRQYLKKMIGDYFAVAKQQLQILYQRIHASVEEFQFDSILFMEDEEAIISQLVKEEYNSLSCTDIAVVLPKIIKAINFEDGHFSHLRDYIKKEKQTIRHVFDGIILNIPYFRNFRTKHQKQYCEISSELLRDVNQKIQNIDFRPKRICIKYIQDQNDEEASKFAIIQKKILLGIFVLIKNLILSSKFKYSVCINFSINRWDVNDEDFQVAFFESLLRYPYLRKVTIRTGYKVTNISWIDQVIDESTIDVRIYKEAWTF